MKKSYKLIIVIFTLICLITVIASVLVNSYSEPFSNENKEILLNDENNKNTYYNNYEKNYFYLNNIKYNSFIQGRIIDYYDYNDKYFVIDEISYKKEILSGNEIFESYYYYLDNVILIKAKISLKDFINNDYYIDLKDSVSSYNNVSYTFKNKDYELTNIVKGVNDTYTVLDKPSVNKMFNDIEVTLSFFVSLDKPLEEKEGLLFELIKVENVKKNYSYSLGLNTFNENYTNKNVQVLRNYLENGGK